MPDTYATVLTGNQLLIQVGDGADPEVFSHPCMINTTRSIDLTVDTVERSIPNCTNPESPAYRSLFKTGFKMDVEGAGLLHLPNYSDWREWLVDPDPRNCRILFNKLLADGGGYESVQLHLTQLRVGGAGGENAEFVEVNVRLQSHGAFSWVDAAA